MAPRTTSARPRQVLAALASYVLVAAAALVPRLLDLGRFITDDEANFWLRRSDIFLNALRSGDYLQTAITTHPGVTTMWLGASGIVLRRALLSGGWLASEAFPTILATMRLPVVLVHAVALLLGYHLLRRMLPAGLALLAALLWAADPFAVGYSRLLHTDALAGSFAMLSVLAACVYWNHAGGRRWLAVSGVSAGLAFLSKSPALALAPAVGLVTLLATPTTGYRLPADLSTKRSSVVDRRSFVTRTLTLWGLIGAATVFALWPALWVSPLAAYRQVQLGVVAEGAQPHMLGNFFLGRQDDAPGWAYYPVALALRLTPWTLAGLLLLGLPWCWRAWSPPQRRDLAALAGFALLFVAAMSVFPKKFDRYMVPAFPPLDVLAAAGLLGLWNLRGLADRLGRARTPLLAGWGSLVALAALLNVAWWQPYQIVAFNQLLGGAPAGARTFFVGWGEGLEQAADWLNAQPDITSVRTVALRVTSLNPYLKDGAQADFPKGDQLRERTGYVVVYLPQVQAGAPGPPFNRFFSQAQPLHVVRIHGVDMAWIYRAPPEVAQARVASFGPIIQLIGFDRMGEWQRGQAQRLRLVWSSAGAAPADYWMFAHLIGPNGQRYTQLDLPLPTSQWQPGQFAASELPISVPADAPAGAYRLLIGLYTPEQGQRLPLAASPTERAADSADALVLDQFELR